jgi:hypothetical protein
MGRNILEMGESPFRKITVIYQKALKGRNYMPPFQGYEDIYVFFQRALPVVNIFRPIRGFFNSIFA